MYFHILSWRSLLTFFCRIRCFFADSLLVSGPCVYGTLFNLFKRIVPLVWYVFSTRHTHTHTIVGKRKTKILFSTKSFSTFYIPSVLSIVLLLQIFYVHIFSQFFSWRILPKSEIFSFSTQIFSFFLPVATDARVLLCSLSTSSSRKTFHTFGPCNVFTHTFFLFFRCYSLIYFFFAEWLRMFEWCCCCAFLCSQFSMKTYLWKCLFFISTSSCVLTFRTV